MNTNWNENEITRTMMNQLGGAHRVFPMIGARGVCASLRNDGATQLRMMWAAKARKMVNYVAITLEGDDTYTVEFERRGVNGVVRAAKPVAKFEGVYAEDLIRLFESTTGLYLHL